MQFIPTTLFILVLQFLLYSASAPAINITTTIHPLGLLAEEIVGDTAEVDVILPANRSPHHYQLNVSERRQLDKADLVLWIGPELETFLSKAIAIRDKKTITVSELPGMHWPESVSQHGDHHHDLDPHVWLNPLNLMVIAEELTQLLIVLLPDNQDMYQRRLEEIKRELRAVDKAIQVQLLPHQQKEFVVLHPAYNHFVEHYQLKQTDFIVTTPERTLGAKHLYQLRKRKGVACVFGEVGQNHKMAGQIAKAVGANLAELDPLGTDLPPGSKAVDVIIQLAATMSDCMAASTTKKG